ncbi:MAG: tetratricopeptide repeat protein [Deltaproteobacteria bacterium]|nr:tetratricopeptide repeat protein [Deltaproteobacteria bacterium]
MIRRASLALLFALVAAAFVFLPAWTVRAAPASGADAEAQFSYARYLSDTGNHAQAAREYGRFIERYPGSPIIDEIQFRMASAYLDAGMFKEAKAEFGLFLANFPDSAFAATAGQRLNEAAGRATLADLPVVVIPDINSITPGRTLRAVQVMNFVSSDYAGVEEELRSLRVAGVNAIILRVFHNKDDRFYPTAVRGAQAGVYFNSANAPVVDDVLGRVLPIARRNGLKVFAWMTTRYADYGMENDAALACRAYDMTSGAMTPCKGLDLFNDRAVARLEAIYSDLAAYPVDGVLFQDDLVLRHNEGFGAQMAALFRKETGKTIDPDALYIQDGDDAQVRYTPLFWEWAAFKNRRLLYVAGRLRQTVRLKRPGARFAINLMYESLTNPAYALAWLSQSFSAAVDKGFDYYSVMAYHKQMDDELGTGPSAVRAMIEKMAVDASVMTADPGKVLIKLQTIDWKTGEPLPPDDVVRLIRKMKGKGGVSIALVPYRPGLPFYELGDRLASGH